MSDSGSQGSGGGSGGSPPGSRRSLPIPPRSRVTLTKTSTPLVLPPVDASPSLELDTSDLPPPPDADQAVTEPPPPMRPKRAERPSLELDLDGLDEAIPTTTPVPAPSAPSRAPGTLRPASPATVRPSAGASRAPVSAYAPTAPAPAPVPPAPAVPLTLELDAHDAWTQDRAARRATPPIDFPATKGPTAVPSTVRVARTVSLTGERAAPAAPITGGALDLVERSRPSVPEVDFVNEMSERFALGDFTGALLAAELLLGRDPADAEARRVAAACHERLVQLYTSRLGPLDRAPKVILPDSEVRWLGLDHRAGFLLSRIDGVATCEEIIDMSGMPRLEALRTLSELIAVGVVALPPAVPGQ